MHFLRKLLKNIGVEFRDHIALVVEGEADRNDDGYGDENAGENADNAARALFFLRRARRKEEIYAKQRQREEDVAAVAQMHPAENHVRDGDGENGDNSHQSHPPRSLVRFFKRHPREEDAPRRRQSDSSDGFRNVNVTVDRIVDTRGLDARRREVGEMVRLCG